MDNPETTETLGTRITTKTSKTKNTTQKAKEDEQKPRMNIGASEGVSSSCFL